MGIFHKNQQNNSSPQQNQQIPNRNAEPKQRNITRVTGVIQTNFNHDPSEFAKKSTHVHCTGTPPLTQCFGPGFFYGRNPSKKFDGFLDNAMVFQEKLLFRFLDL